MQQSTPYITKKQSNPKDLRKSWRVNIFIKLAIPINENAQPKILDPSSPNNFLRMAGTRVK